MIFNKIKALSEDLVAAVEDVRSVYKLEKAMEMKEFCRRGANQVAFYLQNDESTAYGLPPRDPASVPFVTGHFESAEEGRAWARGAMHQFAKIAESNSGWGDISVVLSRYNLAWDPAFPVGLSREAPYEVLGGLQQSVDASFMTVLKAPSTKGMEVVGYGGNVREGDGSRREFSRGL